MIQRASATVGYGGSVSAFVFGLSPGEWQAIGVMGGLVIGVAGFAVNAYFKYRMYQLSARRVARGVSDDLR